MRGTSWLQNTEMNVMKADTKKRSWIFFGLFLLMVGLVYFLPCKEISLQSHDDIAVILQKMPKKDREHLDYFFRELVQWDGFGYVLLGNKPVALTVVTEKFYPFHSYLNFREAIIPRAWKSKKGYQTWLKYQASFPTSRFALCYEKFDKFTPGNAIMTLVNKQAFSQLVEEEKELFKQILHREVTGTMLLEEAKQRPLLGEVLQDNDILIGLVLGYGKENATLFYQRNLLGSVQEMIDFTQANGCGSIWTEEFEAFRIQFKDVSWWQSYVSGSHMMKNPQLITLPGFFARIGSPETEKLRKEYLQTKEEIIAHYQGKDFLEETLRLLTAP